MSKGQVAKREDWEKVYGTTDMNKVIEEVRPGAVISTHMYSTPPTVGPAQLTSSPQILRKGELQVNNLERSHNLSSLSREIATLVSEMTVDPTSTPPRKHTVGMVEKAMSEVGYSVRADKPAKAQALELIKRLGEGDVLPIRRQQMRVRVTMPAKDAKRIGGKVKEEGEVEEEDAGEEWEVVSWLRAGVCVGV